MIDKDELAQKLREVFLEELQERVEAMNQGLLTLEGTPPEEERAEALEELFRVAHSLKGAGRLASMPVVERACHALEEILNDLQKGQRQLDATLTQLLYRCADGIGEIGALIKAKRPLEAGALHRLTPQIEACAKGEAFSADPKPTGTQQSVARPAAPQGPAPKVARGVRVASEKLDELLATMERLYQRRVWIEHWIQRVQAVAELSDGFQRMLPAAGNGAVVSGAILQGGSEMVGAQVTVPQLFGRIRDQLTNLATEMVRQNHDIEVTSQRLDEGARSLRMLPFAEACRGFERSVRDLAHATGKEVALRVVGEEVELDREVVESIRDPLTHLVRNAVDHGIEGPDARERSGKPRAGRVQILAQLRSSQVEIEVSDDGGGLNLERIRERATELGWKVPSDDVEAIQLIFQSGFSTRTVVTDESGRGVGLDAVKKRLERIHGHVRVLSEAGEGTRFLLVVPLTLTALRAVIVRVGAQNVALPTVGLSRVVQCDPGQIEILEGNHVIRLNDKLLSVAWLGQLMDVESSTALTQTVEGVLLSAGNRECVVLVDELLDEQDIVVKGLGERIQYLRHVSGIAPLPRRSTALVANIPELLETAAAGLTAQDEWRPAVYAEAKHILVADDSLTTRAFQRSVLEAAGYRVSLASDGAQALEMLSQGEFDLVLTDLDMPNMNGLELIRSVRRSLRYGKIPMVLVTSKGSDDDKRRGLEAGADAYVVKKDYSGNLILQTIQRLL